MFESIFNVAKDVAKVASAPVEVAADLTRAVTEPVADSVGEMVRNVKASVEEHDDDRR